VANLAVFTIWCLYAMRVHDNRGQAARHTAVPIPPVWWRACCCCECATVVWYYTKLVATKRRAVCMCVRESIDCFRSLVCVSCEGACRKPLARPKRVTVDVGESCSYPLDRPFPQRRVAVRMGASALAFHHQLFD
jgi:hypothetical protein